MNAFHDFTQDRFARTVQVRGSHSDNRDTIRHAIPTRDFEQLCIFNRLSGMAYVVKGQGLHSIFDMLQ